MHDFDLILNCRVVEEFDLNNVEGHTNYDYSVLLERIEEKMNQRNQSQADSNKTKEDVAIQTRIISTKTVWAGFEDLCTHINRTPNHVISFFEAELDVKSNPGREGIIILQGKF